MVFVKVRETYDLHTVTDKMTVIAIHTPKPDIIKRNYPGLLMQCRAYRPVSADVRVACASMLPMDPQGIGTAEGDVAPEDIFNPILYKAMSNLGMSQLEARISSMAHVPTNAEVDGDTATVDNNSVLSIVDSDFNIYYGLLSNTHDWKHANPQAGLSMTNLRPLVYEMLYNVGDMKPPHAPGYYEAPDGTGLVSSVIKTSITGNAKPMPFINCTAYSRTADGGIAEPGFPTSAAAASNASIEVPWINVVCGAIVVPPSRLHQLYYRMVVEWTLEFSQLRPLSEIVTMGGIGSIGSESHYQSYSYSSTKEAITGTSDTVLDNDAAMVSANVNINKVM